MILYVCTVFTNFIYRVNNFSRINECERPHTWLSIKCVWDLLQSDVVHNRHRPVWRTLAGGDTSWATSSVTVQLCRRAAVFGRRCCWPPPR